MLADNEIGPHNFEHILVFYEEEDSEQAHAYEIFRDPRTVDTGHVELIIKHHDLPFLLGAAVIDGSCTDTWRTL